MGSDARRGTHERAATATLGGVREGVDRCRACELWQRATQGVAGEGSARARVMLVGEQPGDQEDKAGRPFVGPAGGVLDAALKAIGLERDDVYVTNAVKHFSWLPRGKRRIHKTPTQSQIAACLDWLEAEIRLVRPRVVVCLGATAAQALLGRDFRVSIDRGKLIEGGPAPFVLPTVHPSSILRMTDGDERKAAFDRFVADLRTIHRALGAAARKPPG